MVWLTDAQKIGVALTAFGTLFMVLGVLLLFDGGLLAVGNILFIAGLTLIIGPQRTVAFFARKQKLRGTICFLGGVVLIFIKRPFIGICIELFGFVNLFGDFFPIVLSFLRSLPFIGPALRAPYIGPALDKVAGYCAEALWVDPTMTGVSNRKEIGLGPRLSLDEAGIRAGEHDTVLQR
ncbi:Got1-like family protein [Taphrina deformans PYCC 5710]|uniref:Got1-like family protein n=1 Tax=Taphrina deformans (strain PYCC 5710 / ATCC 11124 / CBS 356.35 / IMI 108563 / JCM 9778 / NBRC 8474) TaxID=1097556 RepID=R4X869_TAPDE|nr:Got1-like family protein [Taphrina deformans PYCC 5710]|eukprot:CCG81457.1 Got1-like family protein [Taphrina deformans PYCC 5710]